MKILCAVDGSEFSQWAIEAVGALGRSALSSLTLLHVADTRHLKPVGAPHVATYRGAKAAVEKSGEEILRRAAGHAEAEVLLGRGIRSAEELRQAARDLGRFGSRSVLVKGGHREEADSSDLLYMFQEDRFVTLTAERVGSRNTHGTGCTLSSAIAARLAGGDPLEEAVSRAKEYIRRAIRAGARYTLGAGTARCTIFSTIGCDRFQENR